MILKDLLKEHEEIVVRLEKDNYKEFFKEAKEQGFRWYTGEDIGENEEYGFFIVVHKDGTIARLSAMCYTKSPQYKEVTFDY